MRTLCGKMVLLVLCTLCVFSIPTSSSYAGTLSGYGGADIRKNVDMSVKTGEFNVPVTGYPYFHAHYTVKLENILDGVKVEYTIISPSGRQVVKKYTNMATVHNIFNKNIRFSPGETGVYRVKYKVWNNGTYVNGRINVWIY